MQNEIADLYPVISARRLRSEYTALRQLRLQPQTEEETPAAEMLTDLRRRVVMLEALESQRQRMGRAVSAKTMRAAMGRILHAFAATTLEQRVNRVEQAVVELRKEIRNLRGIPELYELDQRFDREVEGLKADVRPSPAELREPEDFDFEAVIDALE